MSFNLKDFKKKFIQEAKEKIDILTEGLLLIEAQPENLDKIKELMRAAHTIKGSSKMMGYIDVSKIAHSIEDKLLDLLDGRVKLTKEFISVILKEIDEISSDLFEEKEKKEEKRKGKEEKVIAAVEKKLKTEKKKEKKITYVPVVNYLKVDSKKIDEIVTNLESSFFDISKVLSIIDSSQDSLREKIGYIKSDIAMVIGEINDIRLLPLSLVFDPLIRSVRDLSIELKKDVKFIVEGGNLLVEKKIIDSLSEPLIHLIRNAIDHGIEPPEERLSKGKNKKGKIILKGYQHKDKILIEIQDDGRGIEWEKIKEKAIEKGLISAKQKVKSKDLFRIITSSGFSTKDNITEISGRGVGLDIVFDIIQKLNGKLFVDSKVNKGTKFTLSLPKNLSLIKSIIVKTGDYKFALPLSGVEKILKKEKIEFMNKNNKAYIFYMNESLPIIDTTKILEESNVHNRFFLIIRDEESKAALPVDEIISYEDLIIKDSGLYLKKYPHILGNSIIGEGEIITAFDPESLIESVTDEIYLDSIETGKEKTKKIKILVLEDSELTREIIINSLVSKGFIVKGVVNGIEGLEEIKTSSPDIIITDIDMPEMDGITFFKAMKTMGYKIPVLFLSSREEEKEIKTILNLGAIGFIKKSEFDSEKIKSIIEKELL